MMVHWTVATIKHGFSTGSSGSQIEVVALCATCYTAPMILSFKHKGLRRFYETGSTSGIQFTHSNRLRLLLAALDTATCVEDMNIPGFRFHQLKGNRTGIGSISVSGNWRITFQYEGGNAHMVNYEDYH
jgi:proteic killer suppression protein